MQSSDRGHFFETDAEQAKRERRAAKSGNKHGTPLTLKSKILAAIPDPHSPSSTILLAQSVGSVRRLNLDDPDPVKSALTYRGPTIPVTCIAVSGPTLFAGSWDKSVWSWDLATREPGRRYAGHSDFVKSVVCGRLSGVEVLVSGGADKKIVVWDVKTGARMHVLQDTVTPMGAVQHLAVDFHGTTDDGLVLMSASSDPHIRRWRISLSGWEQCVDDDRPGEERRTYLEHETSVYRLAFDSDGEELWTASGDGTAKRLERARNLRAVESLHHGDHVRAVALTDQWVITAGRDEDVKVWKRGSGELYCTLQGHFDEITDLVVLGDQKRVVSVSLDGTVRTWPLDVQGLDALVEEQAGQKGEVEDEKEENEENVLTAEEEAELAELMDDDE